MNLAKRGIRKARRAVRGVYFRGLETAMSVSRQRPAKLAVTRISNHLEYLEHASQTRTERTRRLEAERALAQKRESFRTPGFCFVCSRWTHFSSSWAWSYGDQVNWREHLACPYCKFTNRTRASIHLSAEMGLDLAKNRVYATEQVTAFFAYLKKHCHSVVGSEYLGDTVPRGASNASGINNQDLTRLTFSDGQFDAILCFEVIEHVPNFLQAFKECARTLKAGGKMLFSVPFNPNSVSNLIRARLREDNTVEHLVSPEYHGDPINDVGCLCFQHFGWEMLEQVKQAGFTKASAMLYHSLDYGYLGDEQIQFLAEK